MEQKLFFNGDIITMREEQPYAQALLVKGGAIAFIGSLERARELAGAEAEMIDLEGKTLMPAFMDAHSHITNVANNLRVADLSGCKDENEIIMRLREFAKAHDVAAGEWLIGYGYDHNELASGMHPTCKALDAIGDHPVLVTHTSGHMGAVNRLGLQKLGITRGTADPTGGVIGRDSGGEPNGYLEETAFTKVSALIPAPTLEEMMQAMDEAQEIYLKNGITTAQDGMVVPGNFALLKAMADAGRLKIDVIAYIDLAENSRLLRANHPYTQNYLNHLKIGGYKIFLDGSPQGRTAWMSEPYENAPDGYRGYPIYNDDQVKAFCEVALHEKQQLLAHCNGDAAAQQYIDAFQAALGEMGVKNETRPVMIHAQTLRPDQLDEMKQIGMIPSYFVAHTYYWGDVHVKNLGQARARRISPVGTTVQKQVRYTFHQDAPVVPPKMLHTVWCAVNRLTKSGQVLGEDERISPYKAIQGVTEHVAWQYSEEDKKGTLQSGKLADLVILDRNPLKVEPMEIKDIEVLETLKEGRTLYRKG